eukprot:8959700-Alexandrium_andersonii.AAC.1
MQSTCTESGSVGMAWQWSAASVPSSALGTQRAARALTVRWNYEINATVWTARRESRQAQVGLGAP